MADEGVVLGQATAKIRIDSRGAIQDAKQIVIAGKDMSRALVAASKEVQAQRRIELEQARQMAVQLRTHYAQVSAAARIAANQAQQAARITAEVQIQQAKAAAQVQIQQARAAAQVQIQQAKAAALAQTQFDRQTNAGGGRAGGGSFLRGAIGAGAGSLGGPIGAFAGAMGGGGGALALGVATVELAKLSTESARVAAQNERTAQSFLSLTAGIDVSSKQMLAAMKTASDGLIADQQLILNANRAMVMGVADNIKEMTQLLEVARARGGAVGLSTDEAFTRLTQGIGKREIEILDELGIVIKLIPTYEEYAKTVGKTSEQLTEAEKTQAIFNKVVTDSQSLVDAAAGRTGNAANKYEQFGVATSNASMALGDLINALGAPDVASTFARYIDRLTESLKSMAEATRQARAEAQVGIGAGPNTVQTPGNINSFMNDRRLLQEGRARVLDDIRTGARPSSVTGPLLAELDTKLRAVNNTIAQFNARMMLATGGPTAPRGDGLATNYLSESVSGNRFDEAQTDTIRTWNQARADVMIQAERDIYEQTRQYSSQRAAAVRNYEQGIAREAEDYARQRADRERQLAQSIADVHEDAARQRVAWERDLAQSLARSQADSAERVADFTRDHSERLADAREDSDKRLAERRQELDENLAEARADSLKRIAEMEEDFRRDQLRSAQEYALSREEAASRLDGRALAEMDKRRELEVKQETEAHQEAITKERERLAEYETEQQEAHTKAIAKEQENLAELIDEADKAHKRRLSDEAEALAKSISQQQEAHAQRLADQAANDAQRIEDMQEAFTQEQAQADTERGIRLARQAQDHQDQLTEMATAHQDRLGQIKRHAKEERDQIDEEFKTELEGLGIRIDGWILENTRATDAAIEQFDRFVEHLKKELAIPGHQSLGDPYADRPQTPAQQRASLEAQRNALMESQRAYPPGTPEWNRMAQQIQALQQQIDELGGVASVGSYTPPSTMATDMYRKYAPASLPAMAQVGGSQHDNRLSIGQLSVAVYGAPTDSPQEFAQKFRGEMQKVLSEYNSGRR